jgi:hypothetical protein
MVVGRTTKEFWEELSDPNYSPDMPFFQKLALLVRLRAAQAGQDNAAAVADYTKWLALRTAVIAFGPVVQTAFAVLTELHPANAKQRVLAAYCGFCGRRSRPAIP